MGQAVCSPAGMLQGAQARARSWGLAVSLQGHRGSICAAGTAHPARCARDSCRAVAASGPLPAQASSKLMIRIDLFFLIWN